MPPASALRTFIHDGADLRVDFTAQSLGGLGRIDLEPLRGVSRDTSDAIGPDIETVTAEKGKCSRAGGSRFSR